MVIIFEAAPVLEKSIRAEINIVAGRSQALVILVWTVALEPTVIRLKSVYRRGPQAGKFFVVAAPDFIKGDSNEGARGCEVPTTNLLADVSPRSKLMTTNSFMQATYS